MKNKSISSPTSDRVYTKESHAGEPPKFSNDVINSGFQFFRAVFNLVTEEEKKERENNCKKNR